MAMELRTGAGMRTRLQMDRAGSVWARTRRMVRSPCLCTRHTTSFTLRPPGRGPTHDTMKPSATGRILLWRGGSIWIGLAGEPAGLHAHHAVQIALPFPPGQVRFQVPSEDWKSYDAALVAAHQPHSFEARNQLMATILVAPESP